MKSSFQSCIFYLLGLYLSTWLRISNMQVSQTNFNILCVVSSTILCTFSVDLIITECGFKAVHTWTVESSKPPTLRPVWRMRQMGWSRKPAIEQWRLCPVRQDKCSQHPNAPRRSSSSTLLLLPTKMNVSRRAVLGLILLCLSPSSSGGEVFH